MFGSSRPSSFGSQWYRNFREKHIETDHHLHDDHLPTSIRHRWENSEKFHKWNSQNYFAEVECSFWDETNGRWSQEGMSTTKIGDMYNCTSNHLTNFTLTQKIPPPATTSPSSTTTYIIIGAVVGGVILITIIAGVIVLITRKVSEISKKFSKLTWTAKI